MTNNREKSKRILTSSSSNNEHLSQQQNIASTSNNNDASSLTQLESQNPFSDENAYDSSGSNLPPSSSDTLNNNNHNNNNLSSESLLHNQNLAFLNDSSNKNRNPNEMENSRRKHDNNKARSDNYYDKNYNNRNMIEEGEEEEEEEEEEFAFNDRDADTHENNTYTGYYSSQLLSKSNKNLMEKAKTKKNSVMSLENTDLSFLSRYDRYPALENNDNNKHMKPSTVFTSIIHGNNNNNNNNNNSSTTSHSSFSSQSGTFNKKKNFASNHYLMNEQDFSPFGGYPASSFPLLMEEKEDDDYLHNPDPEEEARLDRQRFYLDFKHMDRRSFGGLIGSLFLICGTVVVFIILPILTYSGIGTHGKYTEVINILTLYEYPQLSAIRTSLVDPDTPSDAMAHKAKDGSYWKLAFSDEFNALGRTFYDGDDQFWTAPDLNYKATNDLEWYSPDAATTFNGTLQLRMDAFETHDLYYRSGMLQSWNKLCFTQGYIEVSANLPNYGRVSGLWPGLWTMGNLGRPGYLASTEGLWPYSYDSCDAGITPNQSSPDGISYLPGQKLSICTCDGEDHPNQGVGRGAPELDILEGEVDTATKGGVGLASQSMQVAPFDIWYMPDYDYIEIYNQTTTTINTYAGGPFQQAVSAVTTLNNSWYEYGPDAGYFQRFGFEYLNDDEDGYVRWFVGETPTCTIYAKALHPNGNIGWRRITKEPMSIILNLGISNNWAYIDWQSIYFPVTLSIDYVRIYQPNDSISITCDPEDYPTYDYIQDHLNVYTNVNLTSWEGAGYTFPKNILTGNCEIGRAHV
ncbi:related to Beta-glucan synthesis-associated protein KRE6 [Saccharomycodes ludwigii]|uniref:Related to Beta-glucan synthesis-associated protein KRE6 n=1 Tax=Saccharomycodes ludwigii TaxID=36035 RepID=A0A376B4F6_9ASCO|nr:related to Beta-glucan synthesis-associated protein KRE6 [Saccharomycodes ludwigii]